MYFLNAIVKNCANKLELEHFMKFNLICGKLTKMTIYMYVNICNHNYAYHGKTVIVIHIYHAMPRAMSIVTSFTSP